MDKNRRFFIPGDTGSLISKTEKNGVAPIPLKGLNGKILTFLKKGYSPRFLTKDELIRKERILIERGFKAMFKCRDKTNKPLPGIKVTLSRIPFIPKGKVNISENWEPSGNEDIAVYSGITNKEGLASIEPVPKGKYIIRAWHNSLVLVQGLEESETITITKNQTIPRELIMAPLYCDGFVSKENKILNFERIKWVDKRNDLNWETYPSIFYILRQIVDDPAKSIVGFGLEPMKAPVWIYLEKLGFIRKTLNLRPIGDSTFLGKLNGTTNGKITWRKVVFKGIKCDPKFQIFNLAMNSMSPNQQEAGIPLAVKLNEPVYLKEGKYIIQPKRRGPGTLGFEPVTFQVKAGKIGMVVNVDQSERFFILKAAVCMGWESSFCLARMGVITKSGYNVYLNWWDGGAKQFVLPEEEFEIKGYIFGFKPFGGKYHSNGLSFMELDFKPGMD